MAQSDASQGSRPPPHQLTHLGQLQGALVLDAVVRQRQPEQGAVQPEALGGGASVSPGPATPLLGPHQTRTSAM